MRAVWVSAVALAIAWIGAAPSEAASAPITVQTPTVTISVGDSGDGTGTLTTTNVTTAAVTLGLSVAIAPSGCTVGPASDSIPAAQQHDTALTFTGCQLADGSAVTIEVTADGGTPISVVGKVVAQPNPNWSIMSWSFLAAIIGAALMCVVIFFSTSKRRTTALPGLGNDYDFSKSWATTATVLASALAGIFGSTDVLKELLGMDDTSLKALVGVSAAVALGLVAAGPLMVGAFKNDDGDVTVGGLLSGAFVTLAGTGGQFAVLVAVGHGLKLGSFAGVKIATILLWLGYAGAVLLAWYAWKSLRVAVKLGVVPPKKAATSVRPVHRKTRKQIEDQVAGLRAIPDGDADAVAAVADELHREQDQTYEIEMSEPSRARTAIL